MAKLKNNKAHGSDGIPGEAIKILKRTSPCPFAKSRIE